MLGADYLLGNRVLDIGADSGLFSLEFRRLDVKVHSFTYDPKYAGCIQVLEKRFYANDDNWVSE